MTAIPTCPTCKTRMSEVLQRSAVEQHGGWLCKICGHTIPGY
jgi:ribosomal protein L37AE/L43A